MPGEAGSEPQQKIVYRGESTEEQINNAIIADRLNQIMQVLAIHYAPNQMPPAYFNTLRLCQEERFEVITGDDGKDAPK